MASLDADLKGVKRYLNNKLKRISSPALMKRLGKESIKLIKLRTRIKGMGVKKPEGAAKKLKKVSEKYAERRRKMSGTHRKMAKGRDSNLTLTGSMLDSLVILQASRGAIIIGNNNSFDELKTSVHHKTGRPYLYLSRDEMLTIIKKYDDYVKNILKES